MIFKYKFEIRKINICIFWLYIRFKKYDVSILNTVGYYNMMKDATPCPYKLRLVVKKVLQLKMYLLMKNKDK